MGDKADHAAQAYVWDQLQGIGADLKAGSVFGTAGNHDMDSRHSTEFDAKGILQSLQPHFPGLSEAQCDRYWSRNYVIHEEAEWRLLILNSAAFHGGQKPKSDKQDPYSFEEYERGRVSDRTLAAMRRELESLPKKAANVLLCHHHPVKNDELASDREYSEMSGGDALINLLSDVNVGSWMIIHGHKHLPRIWYAGGNTGRTPVILSAGSLSARLYPEISSKARNQFYIVDLDFDQIAKHKVGVIGKVRAWDWIPSLGWQAARPDSGIPMAAGFGWRENPDKVAELISECVKAKLNNGPGYVPWVDIMASTPLVQYLNRPSYNQVTQILERDHQLTILDMNGRPAQIGRQK